MDWGGVSASHGRFVNRPYGNPNAPRRATVPSVGGNDVRLTGVVSRSFVGAIHESPVRKPLCTAAGARAIGGGNDARLTGVVSP
jgi:hypothetical protein